jgi:hypothetical protein
MYMFRPYQPSTAGTEAGPQCRNIPNLASRNHSGQVYASSESQVGSNAGRSDRQLLDRSNPAVHTRIVAVLRIIAISFSGGRFTGPRFPYP